MKPRLLILLLALSVVAHAEPDTAKGAKPTPGTDQNDRKTTTPHPPNDQPLPSRLLYQQLPSAKDLTEPGVHEDEASQPNPLLAPSDARPGADTDESQGAGQPLGPDQKTALEKTARSFMQKHNVHGTAYMGFGTGGLIYGGVGVSADLNDRVRINVGASAARWDGDDWGYWPPYHYPHGVR